MLDEISDRESSSLHKIVEKLSTILKLMILYYQLQFVTDFIQRNIIFCNRTFIKRYKIAIKKFSVILEIMIYIIIINILFDAIV